MNEIIKPRIHGIVQVYTGCGKGKTTAAWGLAIRAVGRDLKVAILQFMKTSNSGERIATEGLWPNLTIIGDTSPYNACADQQNSPECRCQSREIFDAARAMIVSGDWDLIVLDEINLVLHYGYVSEGEMMDLLNRRPDSTELILTGRNAPDWLLLKADLITEMVAIKHPYETGTPARKGIEY